MSRASSPPTCRMRRLDRIANVFPITLTHLPDYIPVGAVDIPAIARVWSHLFPIDKHLRRSINGRYAVMGGQWNIWNLLVVLFDGYELVVLCVKCSIRIRLCAIGGRIDGCMKCRDSR